MQAHCVDPANYFLSQILGDTTEEKHVDEATYWRLVDPIRIVDVKLSRGDVRETTFLGNYDIEPRRGYSGDGGEFIANAGDDAVRRSRAKIFYLCEEGYGFYGGPGVFTPLLNKH